jgi:hypothetical protein
MPWNGRLGPRWSSRNPNPNDYEVLGKEGTLRPATTASAFWRTIEMARSVNFTLGYLARWRGTRLLKMDR